MTDHETHPDDVEILDRLGQNWFAGGVTFAAGTTHDALRHLIALSRAALRRLDILTDQVNTVSEDIAGLQRSEDAESAIIDAMATAIGTLVAQLAAISANAGNPAAIAAAIAEGNAAIARANTALASIPTAPSLPAPVPAPAPTPPAPTP